VVVLPAARSSTNTPARAGSLVSCNPFAFASTPHAARNHPGVGGELQPGVGGRGCFGRDGNGCVGTVVSCSTRPVLLSITHNSVSSTRSRDGCREPGESAPEQPCCPVVGLSFVPSSPQLRDLHEVVSDPSASLPVPRNLVPCSRPSGQDSISVFVRAVSAAASGVARLVIVSQNTRQPMMQKHRQQVASRDAVRNLARSAWQPDFSTLW